MFFHCSSPHVWIVLYELVSMWDRLWPHFPFRLRSQLSVVIVLLSLSVSALRSRSGRSIINGNWAIDRPGKYEGGGTMFTYRRPNEISSRSGESFLAEGPTDEILDVFVSIRWTWSSRYAIYWLVSFPHLVRANKSSVLIWSCWLRLISLTSDDLPAAKPWCSLWVHSPLWEPNQTRR